MSDETEELKLLRNLMTLAEQEAKERAAARGELILMHAKLDDIAETINIHTTQLDLLDKRLVALARRLPAPMRS